jgi:hypothetical protein
MKTIELKNFGEPDEVREFPFGRLELVNINGIAVGRGIFNPGWRWSTSIKPIAKTDLCMAPHFQYQVAGVLKVRMADGREFTSKAGDVVFLPEGHDAWVIGTEPVIVVDFHGMTDYAKSK